MIRQVAFKQIQLLNQINKAHFSRFEKVVYKESPSTVIDYSKLIYNPTEKLKFQKDGKCLLYFYTPRVYTHTFHRAKYFVPFYYICTLIGNNPLYLTMPASMPLYFVAQCFLFSRMLSQQANLRRIPQEIYLLEDGETIEVVWLKQFYRKLKGDPITQNFHITQLQNPQIGDQFRPLGGDLFPSTIPFQDIYPMKYAWTKYYFTPQQYFFIPKYCNYVNMEVLVNVFNGKIVNTSKDYVENIDYKLKDKYTNV
ncbi:hypothetical protein ABPG74_000033 [Tetrahymena malaccensis]